MMTYITTFEIPRRSAKATWLLTKVLPAVWFYPKSFLDTVLSSFWDTPRTTGDEPTAASSPWGGPQIIGASSGEIRHLYHSTALLGLGLPISTVAKTQRQQLRRGLRISSHTRRNNFGFDAHSTTMVAQRQEHRRERDVHGVDRTGYRRMGVRSHAI